MESPDDASNAAGNLQFFSGGIRRATIGNNGGFYVTGNTVQIQSEETGYFQCDKNAYLRSKLPHGGAIACGDDGTGRVWSMAVYNRTYTGQAAVCVTTQGTLGRATSASKYKLNIEPVKSEQPMKILDLVPKTWFDKTTSERYAETLTKQLSGEDINWEEIDIPIVERIPGLIAEDLVSAGLNEYVFYGEPNQDGVREVEGIMYDRLWTLLIPIVKEQHTEIQTLETVTQAQEKRITQLEAAIKSLTPVA